MTIMKTLHTIYTSFAKRVAVVLTFLMVIGVGTIWGTEVTLNSSTVTNNKKLAYTTEWTYTANNVTWSGYCYTDANSRPWVQLKVDAGVYIKITTPDNTKITKLETTITSATNSSGGVTNIAKHTDFSGRIALLTEDVKGSASMTGVAYTTSVSNDIATLSPSGENNVLYLKVSAGARIWSMTVTYESLAPACSYIVTFNSNYGTNATSSQEFRCGETKALAANSFSRTGYTFAGWSTTSNGSVVYTDGQSVTNLTSNGNTVPLYAKWTPTEYTITYNGLEGATHSNPKKYTIESETITFTAPSERVGYNFTGWNPASIAKGSTGDKTITAQWTAKDLTNYRTTCTTEPSQLATPTGLNVTNITSTSATLSWGAVTNASGYKVTVVDGNSYNKTISVEKNNTSITLDDLTQLTAYSWTVIAIGDGTNYTNSDESETSEFTTQKACTDAVNVIKGIPQNGSFSMVSGFQSTCNGPVTVTLSNIEPAAGYQFSAITQSGVDAAKVTIDNTAKTVTYAQNTSGNSTINVTFTPAVYSITYNTNGGSAIAATSGTALPNPLPPTTKTGYTFVGWYTDEGCTQEATAGAPITQNTILYAKWTAKTITITWDANGGSVTPESSTYTYNGATITLPTPTRTGYSFNGWFTAASSGTQITEVGTTNKPTEDVTYYAQWTQLHTITWMVGSNSVLTEEVANNTGVTKTPANTPANNAIGNCANAFMGWTETPLGSAEGQSAPADLCTAAQMKSKHTSVTGDKTFYAVFATKGSGGIAQGTVLWAENFGHFGTKKPSEAGTGTGTTIYGDASITYSQSSNNTKGYSEEYAGGTKPELLLAKSNTTWTIAGIPTGGATKMTLSFLSNKTTFNVTSSTTGITISGSQKSRTITANDVTTFTLTIKNTGDSNARLDDVSLVVAEGGVSYSNYVTNCCALASATNLAVSGTTAKSVTLTWTAPSPTTGITKLQVRNAETDEVVVDDINPTTTTATINGLDECTKYNYYVVSVGAECEVSSETITAQPFSGAKTVTFNYNGNGQANTTASTSCGNTSITLPTTPTWAGYRFMGWFTAANGGTEIDDNPYTPTEDIPLYAQWEKEYNVTYNANDGSTTCAGGAYIAGETVTVCTTNPSRTGHTFTGWTYSPNVTITDGKFVMPASDVTITAQWQVKSYTVTWNPNGGNWGGSTANIVETYEYEAKIVQPAAPQQDGCRFTGWSPAVSPTMPAGDKTYIAQWKQNYTITFYDGDDVTPWTQAKDAESINLTEYVGTLACDDYQFAGWSTADTKYNDETANITTWVTGNYTPTANIDLYAVYTKGAVTNDFTLNCAGGVYEIWEKGKNTYMAGRVNSTPRLYTKDYWNGDCTSCDGTDGTPFTITKIADNTYTIQNSDGEYLAKYWNGNHPDIEEWDSEEANRFKWTISEGANGSWRFVNKEATEYALVKSGNYFDLCSATSVTNGSTSYYDLELTPAASNVYQSNPNCGPYYIIFNTHGGEFIQGEEYPYGEEQTGLTETTYAKFPAAELDGYTFAGWKDGSPQEDINYEPYLKKADDNLVVSSNKTYYAVYYYYDEEEDIDWSKEFTTAIYADVNGIKYFLAGAPNGGTMSSTTDCGYVSEVTITPGTGANAGKYKITVNGVAMAPEANETDLLNGTYWWTITERSVGSGEYKISGQDKKNIVLRNSSWGHYTYNQGSEYGNGYYYPHFGKCLQHHWTSNPTPKPSIKLSGDVYVTATNGRGIMATQSLSVAANNLYAGESLTLSSESIDVYFSAERNVNFVKADKPTASLTLTADATGKIDKEVYVHYKPSTEGDGVPADVVVTATVSSVSKNHTIHVRNLPADFVIAAKWGDNWYAMPANMNSQSSTEGWLIEVDDAANPTRS